MGVQAMGTIAATADIEVVARIGRGRDELERLAAPDGDVEVCVDLTTPAALDDLEAALPRALDGCKHFVIGTSGVSRERVERWGKFVHGDRSILVVPNFCIGLVLLQRFAAEASRHFVDVEISEAHHEQKVDSPSGTAVDTAHRIAAARVHATHNSNADRGPARGLRVDDIPVHSLRLPGVLARQLVEFGGEGELLTLRHDTLSRASFMPGLLRSIRGVGALRGVHVGLEHVLQTDAE